MADSLILRTRPSFRSIVLVAALAVHGGACNLSEAPRDDGRSASDARDPDNGSKSGTPATGSGTPATDTVNSSKDNWNDVYEAARQHLRQDDLDLAQQTINRLKQLRPDQTPRQVADLAVIESQLSEKLLFRRGSHHAELLGKVNSLLDQGELAAAAETLEEVLSANPSPVDRAEAGRMKAIVEERLAQDARLDEAIVALATGDDGAIRDAQNRLFENPSAALPLLQSAARTDNPVLVRNALVMLGRLLQPEATLPVILGVLKQSEQEANWADAIEQIRRNGMTGAGDPLLELANSSSNPSQRNAALKGLAAIQDPPSHTFVTLLPMLYEDGPQLVAALSAVRNAVVKHRQNDLLTRRGLETTLTEKQRQQLADLQGRLGQIMGGSDAEAAQAARQLAIATHQIAADPLPEVRVLAFGGELDAGPAAAALDNVWDSVDPKHMWRYPADQQGVIVLDLGRRRTVTGIRIWNFNEPGGMHRGWKEVSIFVGNTLTELATLTATGQIPLAPGVANAPDYSTTIPISFVSGRYVRLVAESLWRADGHAGLTEVQILGF